MKEKSTIESNLSVRGFFMSFCIMFFKIWSTKVQKKKTKTKSPVGRIRSVSSHLGNQTLRAVNEPLHVIRFDTFFKQYFFSPIETKWPKTTFHPKQLCCNCQRKKTRVSRETRWTKLTCVNHVYTVHSSDYPKHLITPPRRGETYYNVILTSNDLNV